MVTLLINAPASMLAMYLGFMALVALPLIVITWKVHKEKKGVEQVRDEIQQIIKM